jgi:hypothetical protein
MHTYTYIHIFTYIHTYIYIHTHTYTYIPMRTVTVVAVDAYWKQYISCACSTPTAS